MSIRLIDVDTLCLESFNSSKAPPYAILSHTWVEDEEVSFQEMQQIAENPSHAATRKSGYIKIQETCRQAWNQELDYAWVDTCCIDKSSSAELSEAINSMFRWYRDAAVCFAYLSDYFFVDSNINMKNCKWFTRGWCLQELIAPKHLIFYDQVWTECGSKSGLKALIVSITHIDTDVLDDPTVMYSLPIARRMCWASRRVTTRTEDIAYCLLGIFDLHIPMLYGEGEKAFLRLQEEIIRRSNDTSIFLFYPQGSAPHLPSSEKAMRTMSQWNRRLDSTEIRESLWSHDRLLPWTEEHLEWSSNYRLCGMLANSPADFEACGDVQHYPNSRAPFDRQAFSVTNRGVQLGNQALWSYGKDCFVWDIPFHHSKSQGAAIYLRKAGCNLFARILSSLPPPQSEKTRMVQHEEVCVLLQMTPSTQLHILKTVETILRIQLKGPFARVASLSEQTPIDNWDESQNLFIFHHFRPRSNSFKGCVRVTVRRGEKETILEEDFYLRFLIENQIKGDVYVFVNKDPPSKLPLPFIEGIDVFGVDVRQPLLGTLWSHSHRFAGGLCVDAGIYRKPDTEVYTCSVEIGQDQISTCQ